MTQTIGRICPISEKDFEHSYNYFKAKSNEVLNERLNIYNIITFQMEKIEERKQYNNDYFAIMQIFEERNK